MPGSGPESDRIPRGRIRRSAPVIRLAARSTGEAVIDALRRRDPPPEVHAQRAERYVEVLGRSKGALMKAGQMLSIVPIFSSADPINQGAFRAAMSRLQADAPPMAPELTAQVIRTELGDGPDALFCEFSYVPIAAASIGQVHVARLHDGRPVAVKVQYPGVAAAIRSDLRNNELIAVLIQLLQSVVPAISRSDPKAVAAEISQRITEELDYTLEASNQSMFADAYRNHPFIHIPDVIPDLSTRRILTQELAEGLRWADALDAEQSLRNSWGEVIWRFAHGSLRRIGAFNADPHPGNYVFHLDGSVSFLDFGCVKRMSPALVHQVEHIFRAVVEEDAQAFWNALVEGGHIDATRGPTPEQLLEHYRVRYEMIRGPQPFTMTPDVMARMIESEYSLTGAAGTYLRSVKTAQEWIFFNRIEMGIYGVQAELRSSADCRAIVMEMTLDGPPGSPLGEMDASYWMGRAGRY